MPEPLRRRARQDREAVQRCLRHLTRLQPPLTARGSRERDRHERIRDHYIAYGIRHAVDNLGLMPR